MKKILSFSLSLIMMICTVLSFGGVALATENSAQLYMSHPHVEIQFDFSMDDRTQSVEFYPAQSGYYIIQVFTDNPYSDGQVLELTVTDTVSNTQISAGSATGYGYNRFINCYLEGFLYEIDMVFSEQCQSARLCATYAEYDYSIPAEEYEYIMEYPADEISFTFNYYTQYYAQVALVSGATGLYKMEFENGYGGVAYLLDPESTIAYGWTMIAGAQWDTVYLKSGVLYYLVVYHDEGNSNANANPIDQSTWTVCFTRIS